MNTHENYRIIFNNDNSNNIFAISKLINYLEERFKNNEEITINFSSIQYNSDEDRITSKNTEVSFKVNVSSSISSEKFKTELNKIIEEIKTHYAIDKILVRKID